jgi:hypothetical protein
MDKNQSSEASPLEESKAYSKPELVEYGKVGMMTLSGPYGHSFETSYNSSA